MVLSFDDSFTQAVKLVDLEPKVRSTLNVLAHSMYTNHSTYSLPTLTHPFIHSFAYDATTLVLVEFK